MTHSVRSFHGRTMEAAGFFFEGAQTGRCLDISNLANLATPRRVGGYSDASFVMVSEDRVFVLGDGGMSVLRVVRQ